MTIERQDFISNRDDRLIGALELAQVGIPVIPLYGLRDGKCTCSKEGCNPGKHPHIKRPCDRATTEQGQIIEWWEEWPDANVGLPTGKAFCRWVLDVDIDKGGGDSLKYLEKTYTRLPVTQRTTTGNGFHYHFSYPKDISIPSNAGKLSHGLDLRGEGGLVVAPNSVHESGKTYMWEPGPRDVPLADGPDWLLELIVNLQSRSNQTSEPQIGLFEQLILEGYRNDTLWKKYACHLRDKGLSVNYVLEICLALNAFKCSPPLDESEVITLVYSAFKLAKRLSRGYYISSCFKESFAMAHV